MCITNTINNENTHDSVIQRPIRKSRTKTRRPKFLSLRSELISPRISQISPMTHDPSAPPPPPQKQLTLFPLHPENLVEDREENVALMFENDVVSSCCSLGSFLPTYHNDVSSEEESRNLAEEAALVRTAMRSRERETGAEEKWVCYSEVVEKKEEPSWTAAAAEEEEVEEVTSTATKKKKKKKKKVEMRGKQLRLKLDYEGILNAWSDKAPLFINGESPQTVPNLHDDGSVWEENRRSKMGSEGGGNVWKVPEIGWKVGGREASVLRYKEKRQSRLFSKRIRYQVRKLNAEKRPRMKGRFVKRN
ncbi:protein CHLOROPLAST IMPORT APPARATUS 2-like [Cucurbita pepo subsp. pepo]|uniref:protein CHLOROPLAST IMPORT APPARATUS 2-like n=1 Tax=Cucurbita pepo subsp. pepo TaxID=3664 RepID=UPI000C9D49D0|nr:protein CHLOROPLAST IMPORT APPARATUS 2-like [Cucurbita pepo subsp. pepo]